MCADMFLVAIPLTNALPFQKNDFAFPSYDQDSRVHVYYSGHPGDRARDVRARPFHVEWSTRTRSAPPELVNQPRPVFRATYFCRGNHDAKPVKAETEPADDEGEANACDCSSADEDGHGCQKDDGGSDEEELETKAGPKREKCPQRVKLVVRLGS